MRPGAAWRAGRPPRSSWRRPPCRPGRRPTSARPNRRPSPPSRPWPSTTRPAAGRWPASPWTATPPCSLRYMHSIYRQPATEEFAVRADGLYLVRLASPSTAVLEYYARPEPVTPAGSGFEIRLARPERFPRLSVLASEVGERTVVYAGRELPLHRLAGPGHRVSLSLTAGGQPGPCRFPPPAPPPSPPCRSSPHPSRPPRGRATAGDGGALRRTRRRGDRGVRARSPQRAP